MPLTKRYKIARALRNAGFLLFEITAWCKPTRTTPTGKVLKVEPIPLQTPYIKEMIRARAKSYRFAIRTGVSFDEWADSITNNIYTVLDLVNYQTGELDPWALLRYHEDKWKDQHPEYESPSRKAKRRRTDFVSKRRKGLEDYDKGRGR